MALNFLKVEAGSTELSQVSSWIRLSSKLIHVLIISTTDLHK